MPGKKATLGVLCVGTAILLLLSAAHAESGAPENIYPVGKLKPTNSETTLKVGDKAPDFTLPAVKGGSMSPGQFAGKKNVVLSFVPAAWTPVCTYQWPVYDLAREIFDDNDAVLLGITVDNIPTLYAWTKAISNKQEGFWFPVLSDFYPHGLVAKKYGVLRAEGFTERALFVIDKAGVIRFMDIHDINERPPLTALQKALQSLK
jgi:peroxiredoxin